MLSESDVSGPVMCSLLQNGLQLSLNRFSCRAIQKLVTRAPADSLQRLFDAYKGNEGVVAMDQNGNHIGRTSLIPALLHTHCFSYFSVQRIMEYNVPRVYAPFIRALADKPGILHLMMDKCGCRVVQMCLEKLVSYCSSTKVRDEDKM